MIPWWIREFVKCGVNEGLKLFWVCDEILVRSVFRLLVWW